LLKKIVRSIVYGIIFGFLSPVPGVSAGTVAILLNVYDDFFKSISIPWAKKNIVAIFWFLMGWATGLLGISRMMMFLFENHEQVMAFIFMGLILGCVPIIYKKSQGNFSTKNIIVFIIALGLMVFSAFYGGEYTADSTITPSNLTWIFFASFFSSIAMLIPGVGGSLMMIVFGIYTIYIEAVATLDLVVLIVFGVSMVLGVGAGIFLTKKMLEKFSQTLYFAIMGFVLGSLFILYPGISLNITGAVSIFAACVCFAFAFWFSRK